MALKKFVNPYEPAVNYGEQGYDPMDDFVSDESPMEKIEPTAAVEDYLDPYDDYDPTGFALQKGAATKGLAYGKDIFTAPRATGGMQYSASNRGQVQNMAQHRGIIPKLNPYTKLVGSGIDMAIKHGLAKSRPHAARTDGGGQGLGPVREGYTNMPAWEQAFQPRTMSEQVAQIGYERLTMTPAERAGELLGGPANVRAASSAQTTAGGSQTTGSPGTTGTEAAPTNTPYEGTSTMGRIGYGALGAGAGMLTSYVLEKYAGAGPELSSVAGGVVGGAVTGAGVGVTAGGATAASAGGAYGAAAGGIIGGVAAVATIVGMKLYDKWTGDGRKPPPQVKTEMDVEKRLRTSAMKDWDIRQWHDILVTKGPEAAQAYITGGQKGSGAEYVHDERLPSWLQETLTHGHPDDITDAHAQRLYEETGVYKGKHQTRFGVRELDGKRVAHELSLKDLAALQNAYKEYAKTGGSRKRFSEMYFQNFDLFKAGGADWNEKWHGEELVRLGSEHAGFNPQEYFANIGMDYNPDMSMWDEEEET